MAVNRQKKALGWVNTVKAGYHALAGKKISRAVNNKVADSIQSFAKGGKVKKTGLAKVHKGEVVLTASQAKSLKRTLH